MKKFTFKWLTLFCIGLCFFLSCGKGSSEDDPVDKLIYHSDQMINIFKENKNDPQVCNEKIEQYLQQNKAELEALGKDIQELTEEYINKYFGKLNILGLKLNELINLASEMDIDELF